MSAQTLVHRVDTDATPITEVGVWRADLHARLHAGERVVTLYGQRRDDDVLLTTVLRSQTGALEVLRARARVQFGYHELTSEFPALQCFERELHEQTGLRIAGHPWLKPIRSEGHGLSTMEAYPYYRIEGKEVHEVAVGPIHAGVIEPGSFRFTCLGEQVHHLEIQLGYQHRGVEKLLLQGDPRRLTPLIETIAGDSSVAHAWASCAAIESLSDAALADETDVARACALELERIAMHLATLSGLAADIGFLQGATTYGRLRTTAINTTMRLCGSRFGRGALRPGGIGMALDATLVDEILQYIALLVRDLAIMNPRFLESASVQHRLQGTGILSLEQARALGLVGVAARASGVVVDARHEAAHGAYHAMPIAPVVIDDGDCWSRARVRIDEIDASLAWLRNAFAQVPVWSEPRAPIGALVGHQLAIAVVEGSRGEVVHCLETDVDGKLTHYKVQDPSLRNWLGLAIAVRHNEISDFPICNKSFDLSYCGNDL